MPPGLSPGMWPPQEGVATKATFPCPAAAGLQVFWKLLPLWMDIKEAGWGRRPGQALPPLLPAGVAWWPASVRLSLAGSQGLAWWGGETTRLSDHVALALMSAPEPRG